MKVMVLGVGNPILTDDGVGIKVAREIAKECPSVDVEEVSEAGLAFLDHAIGYDRLIIIDSIKTEGGRVGELYKLELDDLKPSDDFPSSHGLDMASVLKLAGDLGYKRPNISIYAVEVEDNTTFGEQCTVEIEGKISGFAQQVIAEERL